LDSSPRHPDGTPRLLATGGGGYHPVAVARAWTGLWAVLSGRELGAEIPPAGAALLRSVRWEGETEDEPARLFACLTDEPAEGPVRAEIRALAQRIPTHPFFSRRAR
jgi:acetoin utilization protein AcuC